MKYVLLLNYIIAIAFIHFRGRVKLPFLRQLFDHSSLLAPINGWMYLFSAVPRTPFIAVENIPDLHILRDKWQDIRQEALLLYEQGYISASPQHDDIGFNSFFRRGWKRFYLKWYAKPLVSAQQLCPNTTALIQQVPCINAAMFALLPQESFLFPHRDPYAGSLRYHLGLITPNSDDCAIFVDGQAYSWRDGEDVLFDETYVHHAVNQAKQDRIILFCDIKRPLKMRWVRGLNWFFSHTVMRASASRNFRQEPIGFINHSFSYLYQIRLLAKRLKHYNKVLYFVVKYLAYGSVLYSLFLR